jgi:hypothetical protein
MPTNHFYMAISRRSVLCDWVWRAGRRASVHRTHRFPHNNFSSVYRNFTKLGHTIFCGRERTLFILGSLGQRSRSLTTGSFPHDNFSSVYWIFNKLGHMIPLWKGKNPIYFGVITIIPFDNLYRRAYFVMHTFLVSAISWLEQVNFQ